MTGISASDLAGIQSCVTSLLPDTAVIQRATLTSDGMGGRKASSTSTVATVPCMVSDRRESASESTTGGERVSSKVEWIITLPAGTDVTAKDVLLVGSRTFQVTGLLAGSYETDRRCVCSEATP